MLVPLLGLARGIKWATLAWPLLSEQFDRKVLWMCREHPELARPDGVSDEQRVAWSYEAGTLSCRLLMFHYGFLSRLSKVRAPEARVQEEDWGRHGWWWWRWRKRGWRRTALAPYPRPVPPPCPRTPAHQRHLAIPDPGPALPARHHRRPSPKVPTPELDNFHGNCTPWLRAALRAHAARALAADGYPAFFAAINVPLPSKAYMAAWLKRAVANSERKGYHRRGMDFAKVQARGVSAILRKGESVSCAATIRRVRLEQTWRWSGGAAIYLDASCLCYGFDGTALCEVDYQQTVSVSGAAPSGDGVYGRGGEVGVRHSGDVLSDTESMGTHTINIHLHTLSDQVGCRPPPPAPPSDHASTAPATPSTPSPSTGGRAVPHALGVDHDAHRDRAA